MTGDLQHFKTKCPCLGFHCLQLSPRVGVKGWGQGVGRDGGGGGGQVVMLGVQQAAQQGGQDSS